MFLVSFKNISQQICVMSNPPLLCRPKKMLNAVFDAISVYLINHLQYQFYSFNMAVVAMIAVIEFVTAKARNGKEEETSQLQ